MKRSSIKKKCLVCTAFLAGVIFSASSVYADDVITATTSQSTYNLDFNFNQSMSLALSSNDLYINNLAPSTATDSNVINILASSNNLSGYTISATAGSSTNLTTDLVYNGASTDKFSSIATDAALDALIIENTWGYSSRTSSLTTSSSTTTTPASWAKYSGLPVYNTTGATIVNRSEAADEVIDFKIAALASASQTPGEYANVINFYMVANINPTSFVDAFDAVSGLTKINGYYKIQDMSNSICSAVATPVASGNSDTQTIELIDSRDNTVYTVAKLKDGRCWMLDNLALDLTDSTVQSNLSASNTNASNTSIGYLIGTTSRDPNTSPYGNYATAGVSIWEEWESSFHKPLIYMDDKDVTISYASAGTLGKNKVGGYYNYCAATAGSYCYGNADDAGDPPYQDANEDICPAGWKIPTAIDNDDKGYFEDYYLLYKELGESKTDFVNSLSFVPAGYIDWTGRVQNRDIMGEFTASSSQDEPDSMDAVSFQTSGNNLYLSFGGEVRDYGQAIRCIAKNN